MKQEFFGFWVPSWVPWPTDLCAVYGCHGRRVIYGRGGKSYASRYCRTHRAAYKREARAKGGAEVIYLLPQEEPFEVPKRSG